MSEFPSPSPTHLCPTAGGAAAELMMGTCSLHSSHGRTATDCCFPLFCVYFRNLFCSLETPCLVGQVFLYMCVYMFTCVHMIWCKGCIYGLTLLNMCHFTVPPCLLTPLPWEATEARSPLYVQENYPLPCPMACKAITGYTFREW